MCWRWRLFLLEQISAGVANRVASRVVSGVAGRIASRVAIRVAGRFASRIAGGSTLDRQEVVKTSLPFGQNFLPGKVGKLAFDDVGVEVER